MSQLISEWLPLLLLLYLRGALAAGIVEDHTLSWTAAGLMDTIATGHEAALPRALFEAVSHAVPILHRESLAAGSFKFDKFNTWWLPLRGDSGARPPPRSAIEVAIHRLFELDFGIFYPLQLPSFAKLG